MAAILKVWRQIENLTPSIDAYLYSKNITAKFHPDPIWNEAALGFFEEIVPTTSRTTTSRWVAICDQFMI